MKEKIAKKFFFYVQIAGFVIKISFIKLKNNDPFSDKNLEKKILSLIKKIQIKKKVSKIDYEIIINRKFPVVNFNKKTNCGYLWSYFFDKKNKQAIVFSHLSFSEFKIFFLHFLKKILLNHNGIIFHASSVLVKNRLHLFCAPSGGGKTTILQNITNGIKFSDDVIILRLLKNRLVGFNTIFYDKVILSANLKKNYVVKSINFIIKNRKNSKKIFKKKGEIFSLLLKQIFKIGEISKKEIFFLKKILNKVIFYKLLFSKNQSLKIE